MSESVTHSPAPSELITGRTPIVGTNLSPICWESLLANHYYWRCAYCRDRPLTLSGNIIMSTSGKTIVGTAHSHVGVRICAGCSISPTFIEGGPFRWGPHFLGRIYPPLFLGGAFGRGPHFLCVVFSLRCCQRGVRAASPHRRPPAKRH